MFVVKRQSSRMPLIDINHRHNDMKELRCMSFTSKGTSEILAAGLQDTMFVIDLAKGELVKSVSSYGNIYIRLR
jgi:hypothetical protein